jgi:hypothetical protein
VLVRSTTSFSASVCVYVCVCVYVYTSLSLFLHTHTYTLNLHQGYTTQTQTQTQTQTVVNSGPCAHPCDTPTQYSPLASIKSTQNRYQLLQTHPPTHSARIQNAPIHPFRNPPIHPFGHKMLQSTLQYNYEHILGQF